MTAVTKKNLRDFYLLPKYDVCAKFELYWLLGSTAREYEAKRQTPDRQTLGENNANFGPARLVPGPELSNMSPVTDPD